MNASDTFENTTDECANRTTADVLQATPVFALAIHGCIVSILVVSSITINCLVLLLIWKYKRLQVRAVIIGISLTLADMLFTLSYSLPSLVSVIARNWLFTDRGCTAFGFIAYEFLMTRWLVMGVLCLDRFFTVRFPFKYPNYSKGILVILAAAAWIIPIFLSVGVLVGIGEGQLREGGPTCLPTCETQQCVLYYFICTSSTFFFGGVLPVILYTWMLCKGRRMSAVRMGALSVAATGGSIAVRQSFSLDSREKRAISTFLLLLVTVLITGVPSYVLQIVRVNDTISCRIPIYVAFIITALLMSASTLNALVVIRDRDFRECIKHFFCQHLSTQTNDSFISECAGKPSSSNLNKDTTDNGLTPENFFLATANALTGPSCNGLGTEMSTIRAVSGTISTADDPLSSVCQEIDPESLEERTNI